MQEQGIMSTQVRSDRFLEFSTLLNLSMVHKSHVLMSLDWIFALLSTELITVLLQALCHLPGVHPHSRVTAIVELDRTNAP